MLHSYREAKAFQGIISNQVTKSLDENQKATIFSSSSFIP